MVSRTDRGVADGSNANKRIVTGVAISPTEVCAADIRLRGAADRAWRASIDAPPGDGGAWTSLANALGDLAKAIGVSEGTLAVTLMPPLTEVRRLELPPLRDDELQRFLLRNASRYFVTARTPQVVGATPASRRARNAPMQMMTTSASARLVNAIRVAARQAGWNVVSVAPAESAWTAAALALWPTFAKSGGAALIAHDDRTDVLQIESGKLVGVRRFRAGAADAKFIAEALGPSLKVGIAGSSAMRRDLADALKRENVGVLTPVGEFASIGDRADLLAAHFAGREVGPTLRGEEVVAAERAQSRRATWMVAGAAAALFVLAAGVELWGIHRQLGVTREARESLRPQLATTLVGRTTVDATARHLTALNAVDRTAPQWTSVIATLSAGITDDAYLTAVHARGDSLIIDGLAQHASRVFDALQQMKMLTDVKAAAPVRREQQEDGTTLDHFTIAARIATPARSAPASPSPASNAKPAGGVK